MDVAVLGVGQTPFTKQIGISCEELVHTAVRRAVADAGIQFCDIGFAAVGSVTVNGGTGQRCLKDLGLVGGVPIVNVENACSSGSTALREAHAWVAAGFADVALAVGVDSLSQAFGSAGLAAASFDPEDPIGVGMGLPLPGLYAMSATKYLADNGATAADIARVAVKSRANASRNPYAYHRTSVTLDEVLGSKMISEPLTMFECCPNGDGAAACIIASPRAAGRFGHPGGVWIKGSAMSSGGFVDQLDAGEPVTASVSRRAYELAGIGPDDIDLVELHDAFAIGELMYVEQLGLAETGSAWTDIRASAFDLDGRVAVNPGGGLLGRGHPMGPTGIAQICEVTWQLRGEAEGRQVPNPRVGVTHTLGGNQFDLECNACIVNVLAR